MKDIEKLIKETYERSDMPVPCNQWRKVKVAISKENSKVISKHKRLRKFLYASATLACASVIFACYYVQQKNNTIKESRVYALDSNVVVEAATPNIEQKTYEAYDFSPITEFAVNTTSLIMEQKQGEENQCYSPLSLYELLGMLTEVTSGETREEIMHAMGAGNIEEIRKLIQLVNGSYSFQMRENKIANSIWLNKNLNGNHTPNSYSKDCLDLLQNDYSASVYESEFGTKKSQVDITEWVQKNTSNFMNVDDNLFKTDESTKLVLVNTIYQYNKWQNVFDANLTKKETFYGSEESEVSYLCKSSFGAIYETDTFAATALAMENGLKMYFVKPEEGIALQTILEDKDALNNLLSSAWRNKNGTMHEISYQIPEFDIDTLYKDLKDSMRALGIKKVFNSEGNDISPLTSSSLWIDSIFQQTRIRIDEQGSESAAVSGAILHGALPNSDFSYPYKFHLERPFIFILCNDKDVPIFIGNIQNL